MSAKQLVFQDEARSRIVSGVAQLAHAVRGIRIVSRALEEPLRQIASNSGAEPSVVLDRVAHGEGAFGFNALTGMYGDMVRMGILDPCKVTRSALHNAASVAGLILTTDCMIAEIPKAGAPAPALEAMDA